MHQDLISENIRTFLLVFSRIFNERDSEFVIALPFLKEMNFFNYSAILEHNKHLAVIKWLICSLSTYSTFSSNLKV
jgi:hypothetical protein